MLEHIDLPLGTITHQMENTKEGDRRGRFATRYVYLGPDVICQLHIYDGLQLSLEKSGESVTLEGRDALQALAYAINAWVEQFPEGENDG